MADQIKWHCRDTLQEIKGKFTKKGDWSERFDIRDARKLGSLPSVTSITKEVYGTGYELIKYIQTQLLQAAWNTPKGEDRDQWESRVLSFSEEHKNTCADQGTAIHAEVNQWIEKGQRPTFPVTVEACHCLEKLLEACGAEGVSSETPVGGASFGFCGTPDIHIERASLHNVLAFCGLSVPDGLAECGEIIVDLKTTDLGKYKKPHLSWKRQAGGYAVLKRVGVDSLFLQWVVDRDDGRSVFEAYTNLTDWAAEFMRGFESWVFVKEYDPRTWEAK